jgi:hypothetical protein
MRVIFDENVPAPLRRYLPGHQVTTVQEQGWTGISNGDLVNRGEEQFDVLLLADKNLRYQQNLRSRRIALIELPTNRWPLVEKIASRIAQAVEQAAPSSYTIIEL